MQEGAPQPTQETQKKRSHWLEAGALAIGLLAQSHPEAKALEIDPHTPWIVGVQDNLRQSVLHQKTEFTTVYARFTDGSEAWVEPQKGELMGVTPVVKRDTNLLAGEARQRQAADVCHIHTHPYEIYAQGKGLKHGAYNPPSDLDVQFTKSMQHWYKTNVEGAPKVNFAVADISGVWYFRGKEDLQTGKKLAVMTGERLPAEERQQWFEIVKNFANRSLDPDFKFEVEYKKLQQAYKIYLNADIRFVSYEKLPDEPACAGEKFDPKKK